MSEITDVLTSAFHLEGDHKDAVTAAYREYFKANMLDGQEGGSIHMRVKDFLDEVAELAADLFIDALEEL